MIEHEGRKVDVTNKAHLLRTFMFVYQEELKIKDNRYFFFKYQGEHKTKDRDEIREINNLLGTIRVCIRKIELYTVELCNIANLMNMKNNPQQLALLRTRYNTIQNTFQRFNCAEMIEACFHELRRICIEVFDKKFPEDSCKNANPEVLNNILPSFEEEAAIFPLKDLTDSYEHKKVKRFSSY